MGDSLLVGDARADVLRLLDDPLLLLGGFLSLLGHILGDGRALLNLGGGGDSLTLPLDGSLARGLGLGGESLNLAGLRVGLFREGDHLRLRSFLLRSHLSHLVEELRLFLEQRLRVFRACHRGGHLDLPRYRVLLSLRQLPESKLELGARRHRLAFPIRGVLFGNREVLGENGDGVGHLDRLPGELLDVLVHALLEHGDRRHLLELGVGRRQVRLGGFVPRLGGCEAFGGELRVRLGALLNLLADALGGGDAHLRSLQGLGHLVSHRRLRRLRLGLLLDRQRRRLVRHLPQRGRLLLERLDGFVALRHRLLHVPVLPDELVDAGEELVLVLELPLGVGGEFLGRVPRLVRSLDLLLSLDERRLGGGFLVGVQSVPSLHLDRLGGCERVGSLLDHAVDLSLGDALSLLDRLLVSLGRESFLHFLLGGGGGDAQSLHRGGGFVSRRLELRFVRRHLSLDGLELLGHLQQGLLLFGELRVGGGLLFRHLILELFLPRLELFRGGLRRLLGLR